jgi:hypothetical protein
MLFQMYIRVAATAGSKMNITVYRQQTPAVVATLRCLLSETGVENASLLMVGSKLRQTRHVGTCWVKFQWEEPHL